MTAEITDGAAVITLDENGADRVIDGRPWAARVSWMFERDGEQIAVLAGSGARWPVSRLRVGGEDILAEQEASLAKFVANVYEFTESGMNALSDNTLCACCGYERFECSC